MLRGFILGMGLLLVLSCLRMSTPTKFISHLTSYRILVSSLAMVTYHYLNKHKKYQCREEGIDRTQAGRYREIGDDSPLFRCVVLILYCYKAHVSTGMLSSLKDI